MINIQALAQAHKAADQIHAANDKADEMKALAFRIASTRAILSDFNACERARGNRKQRGISYRRAA